MPSAVHESPQDAVAAARWRLGTHRRGPYRVPPDRARPETPPASPYPARREYEYGRTTAAFRSLSPDSALPQYFHSNAML